MTLTYEFPKHDPNERLTDKSLNWCRTCGQISQHEKDVNGQWKCKVCGTLLTFGQ